MEDLFLRVLTLSLTVSLVLLPLLVLAPELHHRYAGRTFYVLWLVLALRLVLPIQLVLPEPAVTVALPPTEAVILPVPARPAPEMSAAAAPAAPGITAPVVQRAPQRRALSWTEVGGRLWLGGMAALLAYQAGGYALARRRLLRGARPGSEEETALAAALAAGLKVRRLPPLLRTGDITSPMVLGLVRPVLLLPEGALPEEELEVVLRHELTHLRRHDVAYQALLRLARTVHWFNPLVWWMGREAGRNLELCCDDAVVGDRDEAFCRRYGSVLLRTAAGGRVPLSTQFGGGKGQLKARLGNLFRRKRNSAALVCIALACALLVTSLVACERAELTPEEALDALEDSVVVEGDRISFTVPEHCGPEEEWEITVSGWSEAEEGAVSLRYFEDEVWKAGQDYAVGMTAEVWQTVTALTLEACPPQAYGTGTYTAARLGRTIDLLALWRAANGLMTGQEALDAVGRSVAYENGVLTFTLPDGYSAGEWTINIFGFESSSEMVSYLEDTDWQGGETYTLDFTPEQLRALTGLFMDIYLPAPEGTVDEWGNALLGYSRTLDLREAAGQTAGPSEVYVNETYGFSLTLPESWAEYGAYQEQEDGSVLFYCAALGPETGGIAQVHILSQPMEATTGRITLLGCRPGCYVYSYGYQAPLPALQQAALAVREQYNILYSEFYDGLTLTFEN